MKNLAISEMVSAHSELEAERENAHKTADKIDSKKESEAYLAENCPHCSFSAFFDDNANAKDLEALGDFCGTIASPALGAAILMVPPTKVFNLMIHCVIIGQRIGRRQALDELIKDGHLWRK